MLGEQHRCILSNELLQRLASLEPFLYRLHALHLERGRLGFPLRGHLSHSEILLKLTGFLSLSFPAHLHLLRSGRQFLILCLLEDAFLPFLRPLLGSVLSGCSFPTELKILSLSLSGPHASSFRGASLVGLQPDSRRSDRVDLQPRW
jgi:hypothetical protein